MVRFGGSAGRFRRRFGSCFGMQRGGYASLTLEPAVRGEPAVLGRACEGHHYVTREPLGGELPVAAEPPTTIGLVGQSPARLTRNTHTSEDDRGPGDLAGPPGAGHGPALAVPKLGSTKRRPTCIRLPGAVLTLARGRPLLGGRGPQISGWRRTGHIWLIGGARHKYPIQPARPAYKP
jgi:hypothetical protein